MGLHLLAREQVFDLPVAQVFDFFASPGNLEKVTPPSLRLRFRGEPPETLFVGATIRYRVHLGGIPPDRATRITEWDPPHRFADIQLQGPFSHWTHTHIFDAAGPNRTVMRDRIVYAVPLGPLGEVARRLFVDAQLRRIFDYRELALRAALEGRPPPPEDLPPSRAMLMGAGAGVVALGLGGLLLRRRARLRPEPGSTELG